MIDAENGVRSAPREYAEFDSFDYKLATVRGQFVIFP